MSFALIYNVPLYEQQGKLCWAFCEVMIEDFWAGITRSNESALQLAEEKSVIKTGTRNQGYDHEECKELHTKHFNGIEDIFRMLLRYGPLYANYNGKKSGHSVVVTGVDLAKGLIYTNNSNGSHYGVQTYYEFLDTYAYGSSSVFQFGYFCMRNLKKG